MADESTFRALYDDAVSGTLTRRDLLKRATALGLTVSMIGPLLAACGGGDSSGATATTGSGAGNTPAASASTPASSPSTGGTGSTRPLTPTYYDWIRNLHPAIDQVDSDYKAANNGQLDSQIAPVQGFGIERFVAEGKEKSSTWDIYVGMTPFVEMKALIAADVIEPWDNYIPQEVLNDLIPAMRDEATVDGKLYSWPFLLDITIQSWKADIVQKAGLDPEVAPKTWDEYLANAKKVVDSGAAPFGCTFDSNGWRSLAPITHSISTDVYTPEGLFNFTSDAAVQALELMKQMMQYANPDVLQPGTTDAGVNLTPDEGAFGAQQVAYYIKYQNAPLRFAGTWPDPKQLRLAALPKTADGVGGTVFWNTGAALFKYGQNKQAAANYMKMVTYDPRVWEQSVAGDSKNPAVGQLPVYKSIWDGYQSNRPAWMTDWAFLIYDQLKTSKAIANHKYSLTQFVVGKPIWEKYLTGAEKDPRVAMQATMDAVAAEVKKG